MLLFGFLLADFLLGEPRVATRAGMELGSAPLAGNSAAPLVAFVHSLHGDSIGLTCVNCHSGAKTEARAFMPTKADCMDCHRLPLTEKPGIEALDSAMKTAPAEPWTHKNVLPPHVVFHHGVHAAAGVDCYDCHNRGTAVSGANAAISGGNVAKSGAGTERPGVEQDVYGGESFRMQDCLDCHRGVNPAGKFKPAATYCGACHR